MNLDNLSQQIRPSLNEALNTMLNKTVDLQVNQTSILSIQEVHALTSKENSNVTSVYIPLVGDVVGDIFLFLPDNSAHNLVDLMLGNESGTTIVVGEYEASALKEVGNVASGVIVTELANNLKLSMMLTTPNMATDMAGALVDQVLIEYGESDENILAIEMSFNLQELDIQGSFLILFNKEASELIKSNLQV